MIKRMLVVAATMIIAIVASSSAFAAEDKVTICHATGLSGTTHFVTLTIAYSAVYGHGGHFNENGTPQAGHEDDYLGECKENEHNPNPEPVTPPTHDCVFVGADKDGGVDAYGGTNDDCAPFPTNPPVITVIHDQIIVPPTPVVVPVASKPKVVKKAKPQKTKVVRVVKKVKKVVPKPDKPLVCKDGFRYTKKYGCTAIIRGSG